MTEPNPVRVLSCSEQDKYDLQKTIAKQSRIIEKQEEYIKHLNRFATFNVSGAERRDKFESELQALKDKRDAT